eukprot:7433458-Lingulodinium_polyedra.AAC.1
MPVAALVTAHGRLRAPAGAQPWGDSSAAWRCGLALLGPTARPWCSWLGVARCRCGWRHRRSPHRGV